MKTYEITFITKEEPKEIVKKEIEAFDGKILSISSLGLKTFVYPIEKEKAGVYSTYLFEMAAEKLQDFNRKLSQDEEVLRHLIIALRPSEQIAKEPTTIKEMEIAAEPEAEMAELTKELAEVPAETMAIEIEPEKAIELPETEIETIETPIEITKVKAEKPVVVKEKAVKKVIKKAEIKPTKPEVEPVDEEERLEALDKKFEELLKD